MELNLNVLTLNVWGIPYVSQDRHVRIHAISEELASGKYDIVSLQEVWSQSDFNIIKEKTEGVLPYAHYFFSGVLGAGLCILSKYPILVALFHAWSVNGYFHRIQHGDWFGGKGVGLCKVLVNDKIVNVYNAHLHAEYDNENDDYKTHRVIQAFDTAQFIANTCCDSVLQILTGDLNTQPNEIAYKVLLQTSKMFDTCSSSTIGTNECIKNSYTAKNVAKKNPQGIRIDHIFVRGAQNFDVLISEYSLPLPDRIEGLNTSYSDHEAVFVRMKLISRSTISSNGYRKNEEKCEGQTLTTISVLLESVALCDASLQKLKTDKILYYSIAFFVGFLLVALIDYSVPYGFKTLYLILKFSLFGIVLFSIIMGSLWNYMEHNGILSGKLSMEIKLKSLQNYDLGISCSTTAT